MRRIFRSAFAHPCRRSLADTRPRPSIRSCTHKAEWWRRPPLLRQVRDMIFRMDRGRSSGPRRPRACLGGCYPSSRSAFLPSRLTSPGLIPGPTNSFPDTSATASASSPSFTGTLLRTNSMAPSLSDSYARKFRTIRGFPSESKVVTRMFHPAGILMRRNCRRSMTCLIQTDLVRHRGLIIPGLSPNKSNAD